MHRRIRTTAWLRRTAMAAAWATCAWAAQAQTTMAQPAPEEPLDLRQVFDAAWARQPEALALQAHRAAAHHNRGESQASRA